MLPIDEAVKQCYEIAKAHGWWEQTDTFGDKISLMHTELSEAFEEYRNGHGLNEIYLSTGHMKPEDYGDRLRKPEGIPIELADVIIRIFDFCGHYKIDIEHALMLKMEYNKTRPYRHGGKRV
jgi:NTP pyrophosphatase (non-canonical NTP hydrolase)